MISIKIYGKKTNAPEEGWVDEIFLKDDPSQPKSSTSQAQSNGIDWYRLRQKIFRLCQTGILHSRRLVSDKRFIIGAVAFVLLALLTTGGIIGFDIAKTRINDGNAISQAQALVAEANVPNAVGLEALTTASEKLREARDILRSIDEARGSRYATAQEELAQVRESLSAIESRIEAEESAVSNWQEGQTLARQAIQYVNSPPYPLEEWQKAKDDLSRAIAMIGSIPQGSVYAEQGRSALAEYREKLAWIEQGMTNEQRAMDVLADGDELARQAYDYTNGKYRFQSSELTQAKALWQKAVDHIKTVPPTSNAYRQTPDRISLYTSNINKIDDGIREVNSCWSRSYASESFCNSVYLSLSNPSSSLR